MIILISFNVLVYLTRKSCSFLNAVEIYNTIILFVHWTGINSSMRPVIEKMYTFRFFSQTNRKVFTLQFCRFLPGFFSRYRRLFSLLAPKLLGTAFPSVFNVVKLVPRIATHTRALRWLQAARMRRELMAVISSNHCHLFYWRRKKERKRKGGEREREREKCFTFARWEVIGLPWQRASVRDLRKLRTQ